MKASDKKQIKQQVGAALVKILESLKIFKPSKRTTKAITRVSKALRKDLLKAKRKQAKKATKTKASKKGVVKKKSPVKKHAVSRKKVARKRTSR